MSSSEKHVFDPNITDTPEFFQEIWDNSSDGMILAAGDGTIVRVNKAYCRIVGKKKPELEGKPISTIYDKNEGERVMKSHRENFNNKLTVPYFEAMFKFWNGEEAWLGVSGSYINYSSDQYLILNVFKDITERKKNEQNPDENELKPMEQYEELVKLNEELIKSNSQIRSVNNELVEARKKAEENDRLKTAFLANMSHEIRTPMNGILGFADLLKNPGISPEKHKLYIQIIEQSGYRMLGIINDIIDISKIESGLIEIYLQKTNINELLENLYAFFKPEAEESGITLNLYTALEDDECIFETDKQKLEQIMSNLLKNALKFTNKGRVDFGYRTVGTEIVFFVEDTGIGIDEENQKYIYERFWRMGGSQTGNKDGAGLGLAITKSLIDFLGGNITVSSKPGKGSQFRFKIPLSFGSDQKKDKEFSARVSGITAGTSKSLKILIAEDDLFSVEYLKIILEPLAYELIVAGTGVEAVRFCMDIPGIDLIMMDIKMPEMDGLEATRRIREFNKKVPIIAQTAFALQGDREKALEAGCNEYLTKPVKADELKTKIAKQMSRRQKS